jgi:hypothetical protein
MKANRVAKRLGNEARTVRELANEAAKALRNCKRHRANGETHREMICWGRFDALKFAAWFLNFQIREGNLKGGAQ